MKIVSAYILLFTVVLSVYGSIDAAPLSIGNLSASDGSAGDQFGVSAAISMDYAIIGASSDDDNGTESGSAYIFKRSGGIWIQQAKLTAGDGSEEDRFGISVSISGDYAIIGADLDDDKDQDSGSVYIFKRSGDTWIQQAKLTAGDGAAGDTFGFGVSVSGDYAVVGANSDDDNGTDSGSAYVFKRTGDTWTQQAKLTALDGSAGDRFGISVSVSGDYAVIGADSDDDNGTESGSAYVFKRTGDTWTQQVKLTAMDGVTWDLFGFSVSVSGDYAVVGAYRDDDSGTDSGSAYIFKRLGDTWIQQAKLTADDGAADDQFGMSVSISDGYAVIGSSYDDDKGADSGSVYIFTGTGDVWVQQKKLVAVDGAAQDRFGLSVAASCDDVFVGAEAKFVDRGAVYVFGQEKENRFVYLPHITGEDDKWVDYLQVDNMGTSPAYYLLILYGADGTMVYNDLLFVGGLSKTVVELKSLNAGAAGAMMGRIIYQERKLNFRMSQRYTPGGGVAQFKLTDTLSSRLGFFFSDFMTSLTEKGLALANFGTYTAEVTLEAIGNGTVNGSVTVSIEPNQKYLNIYQKVFNLDFSQVQTIRATSSSPTLAGVVVTSELDIDFLLFTVAAPIE